MFRAIMWGVVAAVALAAAYVVLQSRRTQALKSPSPANYPPPPPASPANTRAPPSRWQHEVGLGYSTPVARGGVIYAFGQQGDQDVLTAIDEVTGQTRWEAKYRCIVRADSDKAANPDNHLPLPAATPVVESDAIYTLGGGGDLVAHELATGAARWRTNILSETHGKILTWNQTATPLVVSDRIHVQGGKNGPTAIAFQKADGKLVWQSQSKSVGGYADPIMMTVAGRPQLIVFGGDCLLGIDPSTGGTLWNERWATNFGVNAATPVNLDGRLFISSNYSMGSGMFTVYPDHVKSVWRQPEPRIKFQSPVLDNNCLYANSAGLLVCMRWADGRILWRSGDRKLFAGDGGSLIRHGDELVLLSESGQVSFIAATASGYAVRRTFQATEGANLFARPLVDGDLLFVKGTSSIICFDTGKSSSRAESAATRIDASPK